LYHFYDFRQFKAAFFGLLRQLQSRITRREHGHRRCLLKLHNGGTADHNRMFAMVVVNWQALSESNGTDNLVVMNSPTLKSHSSNLCAKLNELVGQSVTKGNYGALQKQYAGLPARTAKLSWVLKTSNCSTPPTKKSWPQ
jgi:hypothetical protein